MIGFYDNEYSTNEDAYNHFGGPAIDNWTDASVKDAKAQDFRGTALNLTGEFDHVIKAVDVSISFLIRNNMLNIGYVIF